MSTNPMQRISDLEAQVAALTAENQSLRSNGNGNGHLDLEKLIEKLVGREFDRFGRLFREEFTGKVAGMITPYIESTVRRCANVEKKQTALEDRLKAHEAAVGKSAAEMAASFEKLRSEAKKDWKAHRAQMQEDFGRVDGFINWFEAEMAKNGKESAEAVVDCKLAVRACQDLLKKMDAPVEEITRRLDEIESEGETIINRAAQRLAKTYENLEKPVLITLGGFVIVVIILMLGLGWGIVKRNEKQLDSNMQQLSEYSEQQKTEMRELFVKAMDEAKESQIDREIKVKMWDYLMNSLTPEQRATVISKYREQVNEAERKRIDDQMKSSYELMSGKRK